MFSLVFSVPLATTFTIATATAVVLLWRARSRAARVDQVSKAAAGAASVSMVMPTPTPLLFIAEVVFFTAAATWFLARLGDHRVQSADRMPSIVGHLHSVFMMGAMAVMAYQSLRMVPSISGTEPPHAHALAGTPDLSLAALVGLGVLVVLSSVVHYCVSLPIGRSQVTGRWTTWTIGALESIGTLALIVAMSR